jgi:hypothetical protein
MIAFFSNLLKKRPSQHPLEDPTQQDKIRQDKIRAFNSIVSILAQIQVEPPFKGSEVPDAMAVDSHERLQLKLSNAFAHLAITDFEVAAATMYTPGQLFVLTWMQDQHLDGQDKDKAGAAQVPQEPSFCKSLFLMFATNTMFDDLNPKTSTYPGPRIVGVAPPPDYPNASDSKKNMLDYLAQLPKNW